MKQTHTCPTVQ